MYNYGIYNDFLFTVLIGIIIHAFLSLQPRFILCHVTYVLNNIFLNYVLVSLVIM